MSDETLCALRRLKPKERALLYGRIMEELSYEELSLLSGCSPATLRKRYERAKNKLAAYLTAGQYGKETKHEYI
jgi:DNA-directed RNA polymerase specialized sigma24 family protein